MEDTKLLEPPKPYQFKHRKIFRMGPRPARDAGANGSGNDGVPSESPQPARYPVGTITGIDNNGRVVVEPDTSKEIAKHAP